MSLQKCTTVLMPYNGEHVHWYGTLEITCDHRHHECDTELYVADTPDPAIIGLPSCRALSLVVMNCEVNTNTSQNNPINCNEDLCGEYPDRFRWIGTFEGTFHVTTDPTVTPVARSSADGFRCNICTRLDEQQAFVKEHRVPRRVMELHIFTTHTERAGPQPHSYRIVHR
ncbi:hypothetical protein NP493_3696g00002 [Ridgeia piscesae]|uniref:Uncharacterized protein n=1 Tax=Ridgeia piscesae TaxID=27915 RepID=A0AAD9MWF2_RIDPI|nr:hypothetical protein NP493_3696g00002 [Ridgeia piscesae]